MSLSLEVDYAVLRNALARQIFTGDLESVRVLSDTSGCNTVVLQAPELAGGTGGAVRVRTRIRTRGGTPLRQRCALPFEWEGVLELTEQPFVTDDGTAIGFRITDSRLLAPAGAGRSVPGVLWSWVNHYVHPRLATFTFSLAPLLDGTRELIQAALPPTDDGRVATPPALERVTAAGTGVRAVVTIGIPEQEMSPAPEPAPTRVLSPRELATWDENWQAWDAFATWFVRESAQVATVELRHALLEVLLLARHDLRSALESDRHEVDPVRRLFVTTWERVAPLLGSLPSTVPDDDALRYVAFIHAGDALSALDAVAPRAGLQIDANTFRRLARTLSPAVADDALEYSPDVDPGLRELFGFDREPDGGTPRGPGTPNAWRRAFDWFVMPAQALSLPDDMLARLNTWIPARVELDAYLAAIDTLLGAVIERERERGRLTTEHFEIYRVLLPATAWQETCWRQFVRREGVVEPIRSNAGSVGMMQVNVHVWRGLYDLALLETDVAYNVSAGNEILLHYLLDYAIRRKEHEVTGDPLNLARSAYAMYNGGPAHLRRYRDPQTKRGLRAIDRAFWNKYEAIRDVGANAVRRCYGS